MSSIQDERYERLREYIEGLHDEAYGLTIGASNQEALDMLDRAHRAFMVVLDHYALDYFNPGEPVAEGDGITISLTSVDASNNGGMRTSEEDEAELAAGHDLLPADLYWARLRLQQALDILEDGWQYGLEEPPEDEPFVLDVD